MAVNSYAYSSQGKTEVSLSPDTNKCLSRNYYLFRSINEGASVIQMHSYNFCELHIISRTRSRSGVEKVSVFFYSCNGQISICEHDSN